MADWPAARQASCIWRSEVRVRVRVRKGGLFWWRWRLLCRSSQLAARQSSAGRLKPTASTQCEQKPR